MPSCQGCGDFTLLPALCIDCHKLGATPDAATPRAEAPSACPRTGRTRTSGTRSAPARRGRWRPPSRCRARAAPPTPYAPQSGYGYPQSPTGGWPTAPARPPAHDPYASLGRRVVAYVLDPVLISVLMTVAGLLGPVLAGGDEDVAVAMVLAGWVAVVALY